VAPVTFEEGVVGVWTFLFRGQGGGWMSREW